MVKDGYSLIKSRTQNTANTGHGEQRTPRIRNTANTGHGEEKEEGAK